VGKVEKKVEVKKVEVKKEEQGEKDEEVVQKVKSVNKEVRERKHAKEEGCFMQSIRRITTQHDDVLPMLVCFLSTSLLI
jgi:hypothetical protein